MKNFVCAPLRIGHHDQGLLAGALRQRVPCGAVVVQVPYVISTSSTLGFTFEVHSPKKALDNNGI
ncbi:MAG: hypothetical protein OXQ89_06575 [Rhodospirillaceae bacterium]|nr:hypothetical protein [Rhodospirillaceae bacterium]